LTGAASGWAQATYQALNAGQQPPVVDGDLADWAGVKEGVKMEKFTPHDGGTWNGKQDCSGAFWLVWNDKGMYLAVDVTDDEHINTELGDRIWNGDSTQVMIEPTGKRPAGGNGVAYEYNFGLGGAKSNDPQFSRAFGHAQMPAKVSAEFAFVRNEAQKKTYYEVFFTKADMAPADLKAGTKIGFGIIVNDGDKGQEGQKGWIGWAENSIVFGKKADQTNIVEFVAEQVLAVGPAGRLATTWGALRRTR
jgi:hypothetical protein